MIKSQWTRAWLGRSIAMGLAVAVIEIDIAQAASIGVSFASFQNDLLPSDVTGVVPQANWNNVHLLNTPNLLNQQGIATWASVPSPGSISGNGGQPLTAFDKLFNAEYIMTGLDGAPTPKPV